VTDQLTTPFKNQQAFKTLGLSPGAPAAEIKSSHRKLIRSLHPDTLGSMEGEERAAAEERFKRVQNAYEVKFRV
jgi:DnaJ like chaperone protein